MVVNAWEMPTKTLIIREGCSLTQSHEALVTQGRDRQSQQMEHLYVTGWGYNIVGGRTQQERMLHPPMETQRRGGPDSSLPSAVFSLPCPQALRTWPDCSSDLTGCVFLLLDILLPCWPWAPQQAHSLECSRTGPLLWQVHALQGGDTSRQMGVKHFNHIMNFIFSNSTLVKHLSAHS